MKGIENFANIISKYDKRIAYKYFENSQIIEKSYLDLSNNIKSLKNYILKNHGERNQISLISESSYHFIAIVLGIYTSNNVLVSIDHNLNDNEIKEILEFTETSVIFVSRLQSNKISKIDKNVKVYIIEDIIEQLYEFKEELDCNIEKESVAHILFTSGTTSKRKGVMLSYSNIEHEIFNDKLHFNDTMMISLLPMYHCFELFCSNLFRLYRGATICINDNINNLMNNMQIFKPTFITVVPELANKLNSIILHLGIDKFNLMTGGNLVCISLGGASIEKEVLENFKKYGIDTYQGYGLTETTSCCICTRPDENILGTVGKAMNDDIKIKLSEDGEILVSGKTLMMGYYKNEEETNNAIKDGWFYTGDIAEYDENKNIKILGRKSNKIVFDNGKNIFPEEYEEKISNIPNVSNVLVYNKNNKLNVLIKIESEDESVKSQISSFITNFNKDKVNYKKIYNINFTTKPFILTTTKKVKRQEMLDNIDNYLTALPTTKKEIYKKIKQILDSEDDFEYEDNIYDLGFDSLCTMELSCILNLNPQDIYMAQNVNNIYKLINKNDVKNSEVQDINKFININNNIKKPFKEKNILITGATGYLGSHILNKISSDYKVYCLVRSEDKLKEVFEKYFDKDLPKNVKIVIGDITKDMLGLSEAEYFKLIEKINCVIHCAANVSHIAGYNDSYNTNVNGTKNIIRFCRQSTSTLHYMSTYSVSGFGLCNQTRNETFTEDILDIGQKYEENVYVKTKFEAECEILKARYEGLLVNIYRIGSLTWDKNGKFQINSQENGLLKKINGMLKSKNITSEILNSKVDFTNVDSCVNAFYLLFKDKKINNIYHLFNPNLVSTKDIINVDEFNLIEESVMKEMAMKESDKDIFVYYYYNTLLDNNFKLELSANKTNTKLSKLNFEWDIPDKDYVNKIFIES